MGKLEELLNDEEQKEEVEAELSEWAKHQGYRPPEEIEGLVNKNKELSNKLKSLNREATSEEQKQLLEKLTELGVYSADDINQLVDNPEGENGKGKADTTKLERDMKRLQKEAEQNKQAYETERKQRLNYAKENAITKALKNAGVKDSAFDLAYAYFDRVSQVEENDDQVVVTANDQEGLSPPIDKFIQEWAKSETAKDYIQQPTNRGAGVSGAPEGDANGKEITVSEFSKLAPKDKAAFMQNGGKLKDE